MESKEAPIMLRTDSIQIKLNGKEYDISWGDMMTGGQGIMILSPDKVQVVERGRDAHWLIIQ